MLEDRFAKVKSVEISLRALVEPVRRKSEFASDLAGDFGDMARRVGLQHDGVHVFRGISRSIPQDHRRAAHEQEFDVRVLHSQLFREGAKRRFDVLARESLHDRMITDAIGATLKL